MQAHLRQPASVSYQARGDCPTLCSVSGPDPRNWTAYHNLDQVVHCKETVFYYFSIHDAVDDGSMPHRIYACTSFGTTKKPGVEAAAADKPAVQTLNNASFTLGRWDEHAPKRVDLRALSKQMRRFLLNGYAAAEKAPLVLFAQTVSSTAGLYMGRNVKIQPTPSDALIAMENALYASNDTGGSVALELCHDGYDGDHVFGFIATSNTIKTTDIETFNKNTWAWNGCSLLYVGNIICLSSGTPPMPAPLANTVCGPQKPGTQAPTSGTVNISSLNPCPLNACCDVWGQCGVTSEFCTDTNTGAPGTAKPGTNGCISNCGTDVVKSGAPSQFISLAYYEGYSLGRSCLYQDARQIDTSKFTHVHFAFGLLSDTWDVSTGDALSTYEFKAFQRLTNVKRILSFGGWAFSTGLDTYNIFRTGVTSANRLTMATKIANFIKDNSLDGVDIDWEYPGEPDIRGPPPGNDDDGTNYLAFLAVLKNLLPGKTVSIAAPASYWYLKQFPIAQISKVVDYIVFMTYDLHGQWDAGNKYSQEGCSNGMCLRSHVNLTETKTALAMITKAGVASNKVVVGVSSYGRSFAMAEAGCYTSDCLFTGTADASNAAEGPCTATAGYISDAEIYDILNNNSGSKRTSRVNQNFVDSTSNSRIVVYDDTQWVAFMDDSIRSERSALYKGLQMGGTTNWASDLESYHDAPDTSNSWDSFKLSIKTGVDPYAEGERHGNWTSLGCDDPSVAGLKFYTPQQRWNMMDAPDAWSDVMNVWKTYDRPLNTNFTVSVSNTIHGPQGADCGSLLDTNNCGQTIVCNQIQGGGSGPAGYEIWNSMVYIHEMYKSYSDALYQAAATSLDPALKDFENNFAPLPPPYDDTWLQILLAMVSLVGTVAVSAFFNTILKSLPYFRANSVSYDNYKDTGKALVSFGVSIAGTLTGKGGGAPWTAEKQDAFSAYMGQVISAWGNITDQSLKTLFDGSDNSVALLTTLVADGHFIEGGINGAIVAPDIGVEPTLADLQASISKAFFAFGIPSLWSVAGTRAFILDSGYDCGTVDPESGYLNTDTMHKTAGCYNGKLYYLVNPDGDAQSCSGGDGVAVSCSDNDFSAPPGIDALDGSRFGGVTVSDLITGAVRTYMQNGNANGGAQTDPTNGGSLDDLINQDVTTPGFIRIPVCSAEIAFTAWSDSSISSDVDNYPCYIKPSISDCGDSTFVDQTSDASPSVSDCMGIVNNIKGTQGEWEVENAIGAQHQIVQFGSCKFGIQGLNKKGNVNFHIGAQDIVDIITESISKFGGSGKVGAKGQMGCKGDVNTQDVEWGLY
ncbi:putative glycoside hydrolase [Diplogelasinospora grovesii]|uniref:chitinase n=1 Tax=Diplogelasinospora grovesii TaxID=303347 RepID=A0AAN6RZI9_9PEZI|nr:putative glycoside hydrolase [Diplogelasinospora grovesii]